MSVGTPDSSVVPTGEQYARAITYVREQDDYQNDHDLGRSDADWSLDVFLGDLAEQVAASYLSELDLDVRLISDEEDPSVDIEVEGVAIDVKMRKLWERENPDLIVRAKRYPSADSYLMVELDRTATGYAANMAGWVSVQEVVAYGDEFLPGRSKHDKLLVDRSHLRDIKSLPDYLDRLGGDRR
jgi:hypothetical protein